MKQNIKILLLLLLVCTLSYVYYSVRPKFAKYNPLDSRSRMTKQDYANAPSLESGALPASINSIEKLKEQLPFANDNFLITWNKTTNQAEVIIYSPYKDNSVLLLNWLADHDANNLPMGILKITKK